MLGKLRPYANAVTRKIAKALAWAPPNAITLASLALATAAAAALHTLGIWTAIALAAASAALDALDGAVARLRNEVTKLGAVLDSVCDRYSDTAITYVAYTATMANTPEYTPLLLAALAGAYTTSYTRARAEALNIKMEGKGLLERGDRVIYLLLATTLTATGHTTIAKAMLIAYPLLTNATTIQRILEIWNKTKREEPNR